MGTLGVLPGPCSGKQDTTEHTWAEVKTSLAGRLAVTRQGAVCESSEQRELPSRPVHLYLLGLRPQAPPNTLLRLGKMSPFVGWQGIPSTSFGPRSCLSQVWSFVYQ